MKRPAYTLPAQDLRALDAWRKRQPDNPDRHSAFQRLIALAYAKETRLNGSHHPREAALTRSPDPGFEIKFVDGPVKTKIGFVP